MRLYEAAGIGVVMGCLYGLVLWAAIDALSLASFILYKNTMLLPEVTTAAVIVVAFLSLFTYPLWEPFAEKMIIEAAEREKERREQYLDAEDGEDEDE